MTPPSVEVIRGSCADAKVTGTRFSHNSHLLGKSRDVTGFNMYPKMVSIMNLPDGWKLQDRRAFPEYEHAILIETRHRESISPFCSENRSRGI
jgi:hypothetical protein